jgi:hypothetical protein
MSLEDRVPYFCPNIIQEKDKDGNLVERKCGKILRPFDVKAWEKTGLCLDCLSDLEDHIKITNAPELNEEYKKKILEAYTEIQRENEGKGFQVYK